MTYSIAILETNSWHPDGRPVIRRECNHKHRTMSGAVRCRNQLAETYRDGTHNEWAHFGQPIHSDGTRVTPEEREAYEDLLYAPAPTR
jgi:hypothetical protein